MTPALQQFATHLGSSGVDVDLTFAAGPPATLVLPARHPNVGAITVYDKGEELTVEIGRLHHSHFTIPSEAATFVANFIADRICVTVDFLGDRCLGSSDFALDSEGASAERLADTQLGLRGGNIRSQRYLWSGPIAEKQK